MKSILFLALAGSAAAFAPTAARPAVVSRPALAARSTPVVAYTVPGARSGRPGRTLSAKARDRWLRLRGEHDSSAANSTCAPSSAA